MEFEKYNKLVNITEKEASSEIHREQTSGYQWGDGEGNMVQM